MNRKKREREREIAAICWLAKGSRYYTKRSGHERKRGRQRSAYTSHLPFVRLRERQHTLKRRPFFFRAKGYPKPGAPGTKRKNSPLLISRTRARRAGVRARARARERERERERVTYKMPQRFSSVAVRVRVGTCHRVADIYCLLVGLPICYRSSRTPPLLCSASALRHPYRSRQYYI
jgi:hypothetical protein